MKKVMVVVASAAAGEIGRPSSFGSSNALWVSISSKFHVHLGHRWMMAFTTPEFFSSSLALLCLLVDVCMKKAKKGPCHSCLASKSHGHP